MTSNEPQRGPGRSAEELAAARVVRRVLAQWKLVLACAAVAAVAGFVASSTRPDTFEATTTVELNDIDLASVFLAQNLQQPGQDAQTKVATAAKLVTLPSVLEAAAEDVGGGTTAAQLVDAVTVTPQAQTTLVDIAATAATPRDAAARANAVRSAFIASRQESTSSQLVAARQRVQRDFNALSPAERSSLDGQTLRQRLNQLETLIASAGAGVRTAQIATAPAFPVAPRPRRDAILALLAGGLLGLGVALLRARLDDRISDVDELDELWELPLLGQIPQSKGLSQTGPVLPPPVAIEAFALARTNLRYLRVGADVRKLVVTSAMAGEGKSTVSWNIALAAAMAGQRVLVVEADLRRPVLAERLGLAGGRGLSELLAGLAEIDEVVAHVSVAVPSGDPVTVDVVAAGFVPPSPIALLERESTGATLATLSEGYDLVVLDTPPAAVVADAKVLLAHADGAIVVSRLGRVTRPAAERLCDTLAGLPTPVLGRIVNFGTAGSEYSYAYSSASTAAAGAPEPASIGAGTPGSTEPERA